MNAQRNSTPYAYSRDRDGCDDVFLIGDTASDRVVSAIRFWDSVEGEEAEALEEARRLVRELNLHGPRNVRAFDDVA